MQMQIFDTGEPILAKPKQVPQSAPPAIETVVLTEPQIRQARHLAEMRTAFDQENPGWLHSFTKSDLEPGAIMERHMHSVCGEIAAAQAMNVFWPAAVGGDEFDLISPGGNRIDVKSTRHAKGLLLCKATKVAGREPYCDGFIMAITAWLPNVLIVGCAPWAMLCQEKNVRADMRGAYCLEQQRLLRRMPK